ncbi:hypothetical protein DLAC_02182 [Tieghemostelium lacteum]|uniref:HTH La-type RNA-binding domain-containing protein n=1 Tax=Tieghemostelium lacteum TaxID=361077 RepID=A0A152A4S4_TIELA|nr:hypothetical protein DLAC_02182 [Tieghemostelium lacteum]|eukprot:KYR01085.1 hypothetical protein DLAC_02182 [Tieghemostelium lacteum]
MVEKITINSAHQKPNQHHTKYIGKYFNQKPEKDHQPKKQFKDTSFVESNPELVRQSIINQINYYFSIENLCRDIYLRCNMDQEGWVSIPFLCSFNRMRSYDYKTTCDAIQHSDHVELNAENDKLRIRNNDNRKMWILTDEVKNGFLTARSQQQESSEGWETVHSKNHHNGPKKSQSTDNVSGTTTLEPTVFEFSSDESEEVDFFQKERRNFDLRVVDQKDDENEFYSSDEDINYSDGEGLLDDYSDEEELMKKLIIVTQSQHKKNKINSRKYISNEIASIINDGLYFYEQDLKRKKQHFKPQSNSYSTVIIEQQQHSKKQENTKDQSSSTPITTNAWNVGKSSSTSSTTTPTMAQRLKEHHLGIPIEAEVPKAPTRLYSPKPKSTSGSSTGSGKNFNRKPIQPIGWVVSSDSVQSSPSSSPKTTIGGVSGSLGNDDIPYFQHPSYELLEENGFVQQKYDKYKSKCLKERKRLGIGNSSEMNTLFRFWSHFLRTHFIQKIYQEFLEIAIEDQKQGAGYGMECVFRYFSYGLEKKFRSEVFEDFQTYTLQDYKSGSVYALEKFWAYLKYRKDQTPLVINQELQDILNKFKTINDFRNFLKKSTSTTSTTSKQNNNSSYKQHNNYSNKKYNNQPLSSSHTTKPSSSSSSYQSKSNTYSSSMKTKTTISSNTSSSSTNTMMNNTKHGFM